MLLLIGSGESIDWPGLGWTSLGTFACAAAANALNQVYEVRNDSLMERTKRRPLPLGKLSRGHALLFAGVLGVGGVWLLAEKVRHNPFLCTILYMPCLMSNMECDTFSSH